MKRISKCKICGKPLNYFKVCRECSTPKLQRKFNLKIFLKNKELHNRFWDKVTKRKNGCWEWAESLINKKGYGNFTISYLAYRAHQISWMLHYGKIPKGMCVLHRCDNPRCVNPEHLFLGTVADNNKDKVDKGRSCFGNRNGSAKLTEKKVLKIRKLYKNKEFSMYGLAEMFGVSRPQIGHIVNLFHWKHI